MVLIVGRLQGYRGNPEEKRYHLISDFTGGINTTASDEKMYDNEFRALSNVDLSTNGILQKRRGFGENFVLNSILEDAAVPIINDLIFGLPWEDLEYNDDSAPITLPIYDSAVNKYYMLRFASNTSWEYYKRTLSTQKREYVLYDASTNTPVLGWLGYGYDPSTRNVYYRSNLLSTTPENLYQATAEPMTLAEFNNHIESYHPLVNTDKLLFMKVVRNENNTLAKISDSLTKQDYLTRHLITTNLEFLVATIDGEFVNIRLIRLYPQPGAVAVGVSLLKSFESSWYSADKIENFDFVEHNGYVYLPLVQLRANKSGFLRYNTETRALDVISKEDLNTYVPNYYEVANIGFNALSVSPMTNVAGLGGNDYIYGTFLTNEQGYPIKAIPSSGVFYLNVMQTGVLANEIKFDFYVADKEDSLLSNTVVYDETKSTQGVYVYRIELALNNTTQVGYRLSTSSTIASSITYATKAAVVANYEILGIPWASVTFGNEFDNSVVVKHSLSYVDVLAYTDIYTYNTYRAIVINDIQETTLYPLDSVFYYPETNEILIVAEGNMTSYLPKATLTAAQLVDKIPNVGYLYKITDTGTYCRWSGGKTGTTSDFVDETVESLLDTEFFGVSDVQDTKDAKEVVSLFDVSWDGLRMLEIDNRLVIYKGNTIWFSDLFEFTYFPNYNFINLPLFPEDTIVSINYFRGSYIVFTKERIYRISGAFGTSEFAVTLINDSIGCVAPYSVRSFDNTIAFLSKDGLYRLKQNYYQDGLENVEKIDSQISNLLPMTQNAVGLLQNLQYWLLLDSDAATKAGFDVLVYHYDINAHNGPPFTTIKFAKRPQNIARVDQYLYSVYNGKVYFYDNGYFDFLPSLLATSEEIEESTYSTRLLFANLSFGYPTHDKKIKAIYIKTLSTVAVPLAITVYMDGLVYMTPYSLVANMNEDGTITYTQVEESNYEIRDVNSVYTIDPDKVLGAMILGKHAIGSAPSQTHKIVIGGKAKNIAIMIDQSTPEFFGIESIGYLHKLGKVKETR